MLSLSILFNVFHFYEPIWLTSFFDKVLLLDNIFKAILEKYFLLLRVGSVALQIHLKKTMITLEVYQVENWYTIFNWIHKGKLQGLDFAFSSTGESSKISRWTYFKNFNFLKCSFGTPI